MINLKKKILNLINELFLQLYIMISFKNINSIICANYFYLARILFVRPLFSNRKIYLNLPFDMVYFSTLIMINNFFIK